MLVETYECQETAAEPIEASEEAISLIDQLGLEGQKTLVCKPPTKRDSRNPYPEMTKEQRVVFTALCPEKTKISQYKRTTIPLRVLQVAAHAKSLEYFDTIQVWDKADSQLKDPVLVATTGSAYIGDASAVYFILARWGEELESWPVLVKRAIEAKRSEAMAKLLEIRQTVESRIARLEKNDIVTAMDDNLSVPSFYN